MTNDIGWIGWTAGIIDGEGSTSIARDSSGNSHGDYRYNVHICVRNTDKAMVDKLVELWSGRVADKKLDKRHNCKPVWGWYLPCGKVSEFGEKILPYLVTKRKQMGLALELRDRIENKRGKVMSKREGYSTNYLTDEEREYRRNIRKQVIRLNRVGRFAAED